MKKITGNILRLMVLAGISVFVSGCGYERVSPPVSDDEKKITVGIGSDTGSLDPAGSIALTYLAYSVTALDELVTFQTDGSIEYRAAESFEVNEDFTRWVFRLRKEARWSDGLAVTAEDFINTIERALDPAGGSGYANYLFPIKNAENIYRGLAGMDELGVSAPDDYTLVFVLDKPCPYFLDLLRLPVYTPSHRIYAVKGAGNWAQNPETAAANGPFYLSEYIPGQSLTVRKNPYYWNAEEVKLDQITYRFFDSQQAMATAYETRELDVATGLHAVVQELYKDQPDLAVTETVATRFIYPNLQEKPLDDVRVRRALSLAVDRQELSRLVGADTEPAVNLVAGYMKGKNSGKSVTEGFNGYLNSGAEEAQRLLAEAGYPDGAGFPEITYKYPSLEMDSDTAQVLKEQWKRNLNIEVKLVPQELQTNYSDRRAGDFMLCRMNWTADFSDPYTYLSLLLSNSTYNCSGVSDAAYDALIAQSDSETDAAKRLELLHAAERLAVEEECYVIPLFTMKSNNLISPRLTGIGRIAASGALEYRYADISREE